MIFTCHPNKGAGCKIMYELCIPLSMNIEALAGARCNDVRYLIPYKNNSYNDFRYHS
jgi:hypothetical protein